MSSLSEKPYYKWIIAVLLGVTIFTALGVTSNIAGLYLKTVPESLGIDRSLFALTDTFRYAACAAVNALFAALVGKLGVRRIIAIGLFVLCLSQITFSFARGLPMIYLGGVLMGFGFNSFCVTVTGYIVNKWFTKDRGTVLGVIFCTTGIGGALATWLLRPVIQSKASVFGYTGWRTSYRIAAAMLLLLIVLFLLLYRDAPEREVDFRHIPKKKRGMVWAGIPWEEARKKRYFYLVCIGVFLSGAMIQGTYGIATAHLEDMELDSAFITNIVTVGGICLSAAKILTGRCYDKFGLPLTALLCHLCGVAGLALLALVNKAAPGLGLAYELLFPFVLTQETILLPVIASDLFGERSDAKALGIFVSISAVGYSASSFVMNFVRDRAGSYTPVLLVCAALFAAVTVLMQLEIRRGERVREAILAKEEADGED